MNIGIRNWLLRRRNTARAALGVLVGLLAGSAVLAAVRLGALDRFEWVVYDLLMRKTSGYASFEDSRADKNIVIVAIDEPSVRAFADPKGRAIGWPWPRGMDGHLIEFCRRGGARAVVSDQLYGELSFNKDSSEVGLFEALSKSAGSMPVVLGAAFSDLEEMQPTAAQIERSAVPVELGSDAPPVYVCEGVQAPSKRYLASAAIANVSIRPEGDGVVRRLRPLILYRNRYYPSLALATAWRLAGRPPLRLADRALYFGDTRIPLDDDGQMAIRYNGPPWSRHNSGSSTYAAFNSYNIIEHELRLFDDDPRGTVDDLPMRPADLAGKTVLVGATAAGLLDTKASPFSDVHPGVEIHANALDNLLHGRFLDRRWNDGTVMPMWFAAAIAAALIGTFLPAAWGLPACGLLLTAIGAAGFAAFDQWAVSWRVLPPALAAGAAYLGGLAGGYTLERGQKTWVQGAFSQFLSKDVLDILLRHPERLALGGERHTVTVFFSDVAGFTALSEKVTPEQLVTQLNKYLTRMSDVLIARGAYIDKFIGDAIMAFWGAPNPAADHAERACLAALDSIAEMEKLAVEFAAEGFPPLACRIGVNTGPVICGMMGSRQKLNYTVMGDTVNTASRLEGANKTFGSRVLTGEETLAAAGERIVAREVDLVRVKGRARPVRLFEVLARRGDVPPRMAECLSHYERGLQYYRERRWAEAGGCFARAAEFDHAGHSPSVVYVERCAAFAASPPPADWDGVYEMKTK